MMWLFGWLRNKSVPAPDEEAVREAQRWASDADAARAAAAAELKRVRANRGKVDMISAQIARELATNGFGQMIMDSMSRRK